MTAVESEVIRTGELVQLRAKSPDDAERDYAWRRDPELAAYDAARPLRVSFKTFLSTMNEELRYPTAYRRTFAIEDLRTETHIGNVMYYGYDPREHEAELGITIGNRAFWSRGYGTDAVRLLVSYLFGELGLRRVYLHTLAWNYRAQRCFEHAGFQRVREVTRGGHDFILMEMLAPAVDARA
jgi:RimJ/RimL family protein N-acetyltransferase